MYRPMLPTAPIIFLILSFSPLVAQEGSAPKRNSLPRYDSTLLLEKTSETSANVSFGDLDGDGNPDLVLAKGRHWPLRNRVLFGDGKGGIRDSLDLDTIANRTYSGRLADMDGDGDLDVVVSNDKPDSNLVYLNDGKGGFTAGPKFGKPEWPTRNTSIADMNRDGFPDIIVANRFRNDAGANYICLSNGGKSFDVNIPFARYASTTITPADFNNDGLIDLAVPHRNGGQGYIFFRTKKSGFDFNRVPFGPADATVRMAQAADFNNDGRLDLVAIDRERGVTIYFQHADRSFSAGDTVGGKIARPYALATGDLNMDGAADIIVGHVQAPSLVFFNSGSGKKFTPVSFGDAQGSVYGFAIGDFNRDGQLDIAAARSKAENCIYLASPAGKSDTAK